MNIPYSIKQLVDNIVSTYNINYPIDSIKHYIPLLGGSILIKKDEDNHFYYTFDKLSLNSFIIYFNPKSTIYTRFFNFELAKTLGFLFIFGGYNFNIDLWKTFDSNKFYKGLYWDFHKNNYASLFAQELLMPCSLFSQKFEYYTVNDYIKIEEIANYFKVSVDVAICRAKTLDLLYI